MMLFLLGVLGSLIASIIHDAVKEGKVRNLFRLARNKPFEAVILISLWIIIAGVWTLTVAFLQG